MSILSSYLEKHKLPALSDKAKIKLTKLESKLSKYISDQKGTSTFEDCLKIFGPQIADLVGRVKNNMPEVSWGNTVKIFRFVNSIATEVFQMVEATSSCVISDGMTPEERHAAKVSFGQELVYFVWMTIDPFKDKFNWVPFKATLEKKLVKWIAAMALESTVDLFAAQGMQPFSVNKKETVITMKAIPG